MKRLNVFFHKSEKEKSLVGILAHQNKKVFFEYDKSFLKNPLWLSPYKLPPTQTFHEHKDTKYLEIFGLFDDSLPDGWGRLLMDRFLRKKNIDTDNISALDRLSFLGSTTMGALTYEPSEKHDKSSNTTNLRYLAQQSIQILKGERSEALQQLFEIGGSPQGARPKVLVGVNNNKIISGTDELPVGYEHWIIKFNSLNDFEDSGAVEYTYSLMAKDAGIIMPETRLFQTDQGERFFGIKRFDRKDNKRYHVHTLGGLTHSYFRLPECSYEVLLKTTLDLTKNRQDLIKAYKQMIFNVVANNRDDHVKNFSFMFNDDCEWTITPAYDITYSNGPGGEHSMDISGEGKSPGQKHVFELGREIGLSKKEIAPCIEQITSIVSQWSKYAQEVGISKKTSKHIQKKIDPNLARFK